LASENEKGGREETPKTNTSRKDIQNCLPDFRWGTTKDWGKVKKKREIPRKYVLRGRPRHFLKMPFGTNKKKGRGGTDSGKIIPKTDLYREKRGRKQWHGKNFWGSWLYGLSHRRTTQGSRRSRGRKGIRILARKSNISPSAGNARGKKGKKKPMF